MVAEDEIVQYEPTDEQRAFAMQLARRLVEERNKANGPRSILEKYGGWAEAGRMQRGDWR